MPRFNKSKRSPLRRRGRFSPWNSSFAQLEPRQLLTAFVVNDPLDLPDANLNDGVAQTAAGTVTLRAIAQHALHLGVENLEISFSSALAIPAVSASFADFHVSMVGPGVSISAPLTFGPNSSASGVEFQGGLTLGSNSEATDVNVAGTGLSLGSNSTVQDSTLTSLVAATKSTVTGNTISGLAELNGTQHTVQNNTFDGGGLRINGTAQAPSQSNNVSGNTFENGSGMLLTLVQDSTIHNNTIFGSTVHGIRIDNLVDASTATGLSGRNTITANRIGLNTQGAGVATKSGILIRNSGLDTIGGATSALGNTVVLTEISGIDISGGSGYVVQNNLLGTNASFAAGLGNGFDGLTITATESVIGGKGLGNIAANNGRNGLKVSGNANRIQGNFVGTNPTRTQVRPNKSDGLVISGNFCTIGGTTTDGLGNTVSGNDGKGLVLLGSLNTIQGNALGSHALGTNQGNKLSGLTVTGGLNTIGGATADLGNTINGNGVNGITLVGNDVVLLGNLIGTDANGTNLGNLQYGLQIIGSRNKVGPGDGSGLGNTIAYNGSLLGARGHAVFIDNGNANTVRKNSIYANTGRGIVFDLATQTPNDAGVIANGALVSTPDADEGENDLQNHPVPLEREGNQVRWMLNSTPDKTFTIDLYRNTEAHNSGYGGGRTHVTSFQVTTDALGHVEFLTNIEPFMAATATNENGSTSQFSIVDTDLDGLADAWETRGIDVDDNGVIDLTLPGANPQHKDIYVEVDAMQGLGPIAATVGGLPTGLATNTSLDHVIKAFAAAPSSLVQNPDGQAGINLHVLVDETNVARAHWTQRDQAGWPTEFAAIVTAQSGTAAERASNNAANIKTARGLAYRYAFFGQSLEGTQADAFINDQSGNQFAILSKDFAGDDGNLGTGDDYPNVGLAQAGVFMNQMGRALGLTQGGGAVDWFGAGDAVNNKPNYHSVMNRLWTTPYPNPSNTTEQAYRNSWRLDFSRRAFPSLDENALSETAGIGGDAGNTVKVAGAANRFVSETGAVDWNGNGSTTETGLAVDLNGDGQKTTLAGHEDWSQLRYNGSENRSRFNYHSPLFADFITPLDSPPQPVIDLTVTQEANTQHPIVGQDLTYTITVTNNGPDVVGNTVVVDTIPAGATFVSAAAQQGTFSRNGNVVTFQVGFLGSAQSATLTVVVTPNSAATMRNSASVTPTANDPNTANNTSNLDLTAVNPPDVSITQSASASKVDLNKQFSYTLVVTNNGTVAADGVKVVDTLPSGLAFVSAQAGQGTFTNNGNGLEFQVGTLAPGAATTLTIVARATAAGTKHNQSTVSAALADDSSNNQATTSVVVMPKPVTAPRGKVSVLKVGPKREQVITLSFDGVLNSSTVKKLSNYRLYSAGRDRKFGTKDDVVTALKSATFDSKKKLLTIRTKTALNLSQPLQLKIKNGGLKDSFGRSIDGDRNGTVGGELLATVTRGGVSVKKK